jgi:hypothetical protein
MLACLSACMHVCLHYVGDGAFVVATIVTVGVATANYNVDADGARSNVDVSA